MLNETQQKIYEFLLERLSCGVPPSVREIGANVGLKSTSSVQANLDALENEGLIVRDPLLKRSIRIVGQNESVKQVPILGTVTAVDSPDTRLSSPGFWQFTNKLNDKTYAVESPDAIRASDDRGFTWLRYGENGLPAAIASDRGNYRTVVMGFPLETLTTAQERTSLMTRIMEYLK